MRNYKNPALDGDSTLGLGLERVVVDGHDHLSGGLVVGRLLAGGEPPNEANEQAGGNDDHQQALEPIRHAVVIGTNGHVVSPFRAR